MKDKRKVIPFITSDYKTLFSVKDGESIRLTSGYDGEVKTLKCRYIDDTHLTLGGKYREDYHICQLAEIVERNGHICEEIPGQIPMLNIIAAKYGEPLVDVEIPMTQSAVESLVGGTYTTEDVRGEHIMLRGKDGVAVCKSEDGDLAPVHPYWARTLKRELGIIPPPSEKADFLGKIERFNDKATEQAASSASPDKSRNSKEL